MGQILAILQLIPAIIKAVQSVEEAIPMSGQGKAKMDMVMQIINVAGEGANNLIPIIQKAIDVVVSTLNNIGVFKKD